MENGPKCCHRADRPTGAKLNFIITLFNIVRDKGSNPGFDC